MIDSVSQSYDHHDADRALIERSMDLSSQELTETNNKLRLDTARQKVVLEKLKEAILSIPGQEGKIFYSSRIEDEDLIRVADFLAGQIRQRNEAEEKLRIYELAINSSSDGIILTDPQLPDNPVIFVNPAFLNTTGYSKEEVIGKNCRFLQGNERNQPELKKLRDAIVNGTTCHALLKNFKKNGEAFWNDFHLSPILGDQNTVKYFLGVQNDITQEVKKEQLLLTNSEQRKELMHIAEEVLAAQTEAKVIEVIVNRLENIVRFDTAAIYIVDDEKGILRPIAVVGPHWTSPNLEEWVIAKGTGTIGFIVDSKNGELINNSHLDPRTVYPKGAVIKQEHLIVQPLRSGDKVWGAFVVNRMSEQQFTEIEYEMVQFLTSYASLSLQNISLISKLTDSEQSLRNVLETISDGVVSIDHQGTILYANEGIEKIFGYDPLELNGADLEILMPEFYRPLHREGIQRYLETGKKHLNDWHSVNLPGRHKNGHEVPLEISFGESNKGGKQIFTGIIRDITERKRADELLRATTTRLTMLIQTIQAGVLVEDETRHISLINKTFCSMFGIPAAPELLIGADCSQSAEQSKPMFRDPETFIERINTILRERTIVTNEECVLVDGRVFERDYVPIYVDADYKGHMWLYRDITVRKANEAEMEKLARFTNENPNPVMRVDKDHRIIYMNAPGRRMMSEVGSLREDIVPAGWRPIVDSTLLNDRTTEFEIAAAEGTPVYLTHFVPVNQSGYVNVYGRDITERKVAEWDATKAKMIAEESMHAKQDFLAKMSHELRTPMNAVLGLTNLIMSTPLNEDQRSLVDGIKSSGKNLLVIINDILNLAKIEAGKMEIDSSDFIFRDMLESIRVSMFPLAQQKGIDLQFSVDTDIPEVLNGDPVRLGQVIINLLSNAIKFTQYGGVQLHCKLTDAPGGARRLRLDVIDSGIGIPEEKLRTIFDAFSQASQDITVRYGGTGLGLTIVEQLTGLMNGEVTVSSEPGKGSIFSLTLPLIVGTKDKESVAAAAVRPRITFSALNGTVLLVEDNPTNQLVAVKTMEMWNIDVDVASDGYEALKLLNERTYDLVLMDIQMPGIDGFETTRRIRTECAEPQRSVPIFAMTASVLYDPEMRAIKGGMNGYISKPFELEDLYAKISRYLSMSSAPVIDSAAAVRLPEHTAEFRHVNTAMLERIAPDNPEFISEMIHLFEKNTPEYVEALKQALNAHDYAALKRAAHKLKPTGAYIGVEALKPMMAEIELLAEHRTDASIIAERIGELDILCEEIYSDIRQWKTTIDQRTNTP